MKIYSINTDSFEPVSFEKSYLYNQYDKIQSFLIKNYGIKFKDVLAKPIITDQQVVWHGNFSNTMNRISDFDEEVQNQIKEEYWTLLTFLKDEINKLSLAKDPEKKSWGNLLREVFNDENNIILTDGTLWCLLWGWKFRNNAENYLPPVFKDNILKNSSANQGESARSIPIISNAPIKDNNSTSLNTNEEEEQNEETNSDNDTKKPKKEGFWLSFIHALRRFVYRYWGLLFLIMFLLLMSCLFKGCGSNNCNNCNNIDSLNSKILELQKKVADRCKN
jgi:hypothetical protein